MRHGTLPSFAALGAVLLWSCTIGVSRLLTQSLGAMEAGAAIFLLAGAIATGWALASGRWRGLLSLPPRYLLGCGGLFALYNVCLYGAIGLASAPRAVVETGVINYLWPGLTLAFSVPLLGKRAGVLLAAGAVTAFAGVALAVWPSESRSLSAIAAGLRVDALPYALAAVAAVTWAAFSNLTRRWGGMSTASGVPLFMLTAGLVMALLAGRGQASPQWSWSLVGPLAFMTLGPALSAYALWDLAMRRGSVVFAASCAYLTPLLSTGVSIVLLKAPAAPELWLAAGMVVAGAVMCRLGVREPAELPAEPAITAAAPPTP